MKYIKAYIIIAAFSCSITNAEENILYSAFPELLDKEQDERPDIKFRVEGVEALFTEVIELSRNVTMHSGSLEREDIERLGVNIRDWVKQVGA